jgi:NAD(P)H-dependent flavin oxidoreductase YrpB (nitropropane dioxygenase family)
MKTRFTELVGIERPIVQDGMGTYNTSRLAAAVSEAGGLGTVSMPALAGDPSRGTPLLREHIEWTASMTTKPFAVNIGVGIDKETGALLPMSGAMIDTVLEMREENPELAEQLKVLTTSGGFPGPFRERIAASGLIHMQKVGSTRQAIKAAEAGVDVIIASGYEMGGHTHRSPVHTFVLVPNVTEAVDVPVLLSGGARDGRTLAAALTLGADGVGMGTRFIVTEENDFHPNYKQRLIDAREGEDAIFPAWFGPARGLRNRGMERLWEIVENKELEGDELGMWKDDALVRVQRDGDVETGIVAAGQVASGIHEVVSVPELLQTMTDDAERILQRLAAGIADKAAT